MNKRTIITHLSNGKLLNMTPADLIWWESRAKEPEAYAAAELIASIVVIWKLKYLL
jgi:hypothetical protein